MEHEPGRRVACEALLPWPLTPNDGMRGGDGTRRSARPGSRRSLESGTAPDPARAAPPAGPEPGRPERQRAADAVLADGRATGRTGGRAGDRAHGKRPWERRPASHDAGAGNLAAGPGAV